VTSIRPGTESRLHVVTHEIGASHESDFRVEAFADFETFELKAVPVRVVVDIRKVAFIVTGHALLFCLCVKRGYIHRRRKRLKPIDAERLSRRRAELRGLIASRIKNTDITAAE
jgi:hypothetical protein